MAQRLAKLEALLDSSKKASVEVPVMSAVPAPTTTPGLSQSENAASPPLPPIHQPTISTYDHAPRGIETDEVVVMDENASKQAATSPCAVEIAGSKPESQNLVKIER
ncbi:uncharacterized protein A1O5_12304 [Cladophialophora psammophila CBS 110553]|uniref:Uncharacterized protein n=1 Tax=Cladophialophora psammophila CBS 110553 TaxID=1182543 RepID=W9VV29_9EURO|nr:uncharacterized protein A1O5_12304 [Cladophialophora psammophila CBS 110553]EXJ59423.1 hypothetical protein A1O5_12304 [Cladophialophora psammophila CBS 110553]